MENNSLDVDNLEESDIINAGAISGARNPYGKAAEKHSQQYYQFIRKISSDIPKIAQNTGYNEEFIKEIKQYLFIETHDLGDGLRQFDPDFMIAQSRQRLIEGKNILPHDMTLLLHEELERKFMNDGLSQHLAHIKASEKYNYSEEARKYYASIKKYKKE